MAIEGRLRLATPPDLRSANVVEILAEIFFHLRKADMASRSSLETELSTTATETYAAPKNGVGEG